MIKIVLGYDGSSHSRKALERVGEIFAGHDADVSVVSVVHVAAPTHGSSYEDSDEAREREAELEEATSYLAEREVRAAAVKAHGDPATAIVEHAREVGADLIVVGTHGRGLARDILLGSVSTKVTHHAHCDVLVVRQPGEGHPEHDLS